MATKTKVTIGGKAVDLEDVGDLAKVQATLVPANWPTTKRDCVRLFLTVQEMLKLQLARHLAFNWKNICKVTQEEAADGNPAKCKLTFSFELDQSAPSVAAIAGLGLSYSVKFGTKGKPQTCDINQADLFDGDDVGTALNVESLEAENAPPVEEPKEDKPKKPKKGKKGDADKVVAMPPADGQ